MAKILVLGGGFGGAYAAKALLSKLRGSVHRVIVVSRSDSFVFTPLLHEVATGFLGGHDITQEMQRILRSPNFEFVKAEVNKISFAEKSVDTSAGIISYDYLLVALGSIPNLGLLWKLNASPESVYTLKTMGDATKIRQKLEELAVKFEGFQSENKRLNIVFIGAGATAIELAGEVSSFYMSRFSCDGYESLTKKVSISMIEKNPSVLPQVDDTFRAEAIKKLASMNIRVYTGADLKKIEAGKVEMQHDGKMKSMSASIIFLAAGVAPSPVEAGKETKNERGFFAVSPFLEIKGTGDAWAIGDNAFCINPLNGKPVPMLAQSAKDEGTFVAGNITRKMNGLAQKKYAFHSKGFLLSVGQGFAIGDVIGRLMKGWALWWMKRTVYTSSFFGLFGRLAKFWEISIKSCFRKK